MSAVHLMVPGLARRHLDGHLAHGILSDRPSQRRADLVVSFPATLANVQATLLSGRTARSRGEIPRTVTSVGAMALAGVPAAIEVRALGDHAPSERPVHFLFTALQEAMVRHGIGSAEERVALEGLDRLLREILERSPAVLLSGGPALQAVQHRIELAPAQPTFEWMEGALAGTAVALSDTARAELLLRNGVERVLVGDALASWGAPPTDRAIIVAEPGYSFTAGRVASGHREPVDPTCLPPLLGWGSHSDQSWPAAVHDYRVGPTLAVASGLLPGTCDDDALPW